MEKYTLSELSEKSGVSKREIRKHLIAQSLRNQPASRGYYVYGYEKWIRNLKDNQIIESASFFDDNESTVPLNCSFDEVCDVDISDSSRNNCWSNNELNGIKFADLFCGAGGLSLGLVMAGYEPVLGVELNNDAYDTYKNNLGKRFNKLNSFSTLDITSKKNKKSISKYLKSEKIQLLCGGFPCQGFSLSGSRVISDPRNTLYHDMIEIVAEVKPDFILMENVLGLLTIYDGKVLRKIINDYMSLGYSIAYKEINAADYEVAQTRKRVIFVGNRCNKKNVFPLPLLCPDNYINCGSILDKYRNLNENTSINHTFTKHSVKMKEALKNVEPGRSLYSTYSDSWKKLVKEKPSFTVKGNHGATNIHYELPRVITPREMAALQSFPDDYIFIGSKKSQVTQIGNAVPPYVARAFGIALKDEILKR